MEWDDPVGAARLGATFRLLMQVRILVTALTLALVPSELMTLETLLLLSGVGSLSAIVLFSWQQIVPSLLRHPVLIGFDVFVAYAVLEIGGVTGPFFLFTVVTSMLAGLLLVGRWLVAVCAMQVLLYFAAATGFGAARELVNFQTVVAMPAFYLVAGFAGARLRHLYDRQSQLEAARRAAEVVAAAAEERSRLAREMHDSLAKTLRGIAMSAQALPLWVDRAPARAAEEARRIAAAAEVASREARQLIEDLRDETFQQPLGRAVADVAAAWAEETGTAVTQRVDTGIDLPLRARYEVIAILKEALENVHRHARATAVEVCLTQETDRTVLRVRDDGRGFDGGQDLGRLLSGGHYGLVGMRERAHNAGASLSVDSAPRAGTTITVVVPDPGVESAGSVNLEVA
ncbi:sensor histidine kinase [Actinomadura keratinilytica]|jgi:signal transduction histidine kinase|uniref:histidine kinase n=1 Tax=Actinomadura keratinilytica TaxID=547461 RepID=A0ABP7Y9X3_9ACTN